MSRLNVPQYIQAAAVGHVNIEKHQIPIVLPQLIECLVAARSFAHGIDARIGFEKLLESRANHRVIVSDQYS
jgi:hypothetical protein